MTNRSSLVVLLLLTMLSGCASVTVNYTSAKPKTEVSECITSGWIKSPSSGFEAPVIHDELVDFDFVAFALGIPHLIPKSPYTIGSPYELVSQIRGNEHVGFSVWAEVRDSATGSTTVYHRENQMMHSRIDSVVVNCQGETQ